MELVFKESSQVLSGKPAYEVEFEASSDFSIHIERPEGGRFLVYQKSVANGKYSLVDGVGYQDYKDVFDIDFAGSVYPKWIKIVSEVEPTYAAIISDGEVTEIKAQSKVVEITSNGTTNITPDEGFGYLNSVKVKTNVAQSGGGSTSGGGKYGMLFFDIANVSENMTLQILWASFLVNLGHQIVPATAYAYDSQGYEENLYGIKKVAVVYGYAQSGTQVTEDMIMSLFGELNAQEITEEEFYNVSSPSTPEE